MKIEQVKKIFEEDDSLKYALATNIAKYGRPQSKKSDKKVKLTKSLEKKREKAVKDLKKSMGEQDMGSPFPVPDITDKGYIAARKVIDQLRATTFRKLNPDELETFRREIASAFDMTLKEAFSGFMRGEPEAPDSTPFKPTGSVSQFQEDLRALFGKFKDDLRNPDFIRGVGEIMVNWKSLLRSQFDEGDTYEKMAAKGKKAGNLKQGTVRKRLGIPKDKKIPLSLINKELSRMRKMDKNDDKKGVQLGDKNQKYYKALQLAKTLKTTTNLNEDLNTLKRYKVQLDKLYGPQLRFTINNDPNNPERSRIDVRGSQQELLNFGSEMHGTQMGDYEFFHVDDMDRGEMVSLVRSDSIMSGGGSRMYTEKKDKTDRCLRIARQKMPKTSAYRSGLIVKCRKGMIWKKRK